jgi:hypothetical protein
MISDAREAADTSAVSQDSADAESAVCWDSDDSEKAVLETVPNQRSVWHRAEQYYWRLPTLSRR